MSADLLWSIVRKNSCFLVKSQGLTLTKEPNNLKNLNSFKYNGYVNKKTVGVDAATSGKGVVLTLRKTKKGSKYFKSLCNNTEKTNNILSWSLFLGEKRPGKSQVKSTVRGSRHAVQTIKNTLTAGSYRKDLVDTAVKRTCAIVRSQNASVVKKQRSRRKKN